MRYAMIMAGGAGTRLWPMSRKARPKQLLPFIHGQSLLQIAVQRLEGLVPADRRFICTGESFRSLIRSALPQISDAQILGEPVGRDTLNAVAFTAVVLLKQDPQATFAVLTADHLIDPPQAFRDCIDTGFRLVDADANRLVTFAITPTHAATGFGYVEQGAMIQGFEGAREVIQFVEKPDRQTAERYLASGNYGWNSGMFVFHAKTLLEAVRRFKPEAMPGLLQIADAWGTPKGGEILRDVYPTLPKISIDFAIMEPASRDATLRVCTVPMNLHWRDVGSWTSYGEELAADNLGNASNTRTLHLDSRNVLAVSDDPQHTITTIGCEDLIIIHTADVTMICRRDDEQRVKELAGTVDPSLQ